MYTLKYGEQSDLPTAIKCQLKTGMVLVVIPGGPLLMMEVLEVTRPQALTTEEMEVDKNENVVTLDVAFSPWVSTVCDSLRHRAMRLFSKDQLGT